MKLGGSPETAQPPSQSGSAPEPRWISPRAEVDQPLRRGGATAKTQGGAGGLRAPPVAREACGLRRSLCGLRPLTAPYRPRLPRCPSESPHPPSCPSVSPFVCFVISPWQSCAGHAHPPPYARCGLCDCPPSSSACFVSLRVPLCVLRDLPWQSCAGHARAPPLCARCGLCDCPPSSPACFVSLRVSLRALRGLPILAVPSAVADPKSASIRAIRGFPRRASCPFIKAQKKPPTEWSRAFFVAVAGVSRRGWPWLPAWRRG